MSGERTWQRADEGARPEQPPTGRIRAARAGRMSDPTSLLDWRRRVAALYSEVRSTADASTAHAAWRQGRDRLLATHPESPIPQDERSSFDGVPMAPYDERLRFTLEVDADVAPVRTEMPAGRDGTVALERAGVLHVPTVGDLDVWWLASYGGGIFVPIKDGGAGTTSYGGGRYVIDTVKGADLGGDHGYLVLDLNFAYNPSCAYNPTWVCPLAPPGNTVSTKVLAGELCDPPTGEARRRTGPAPPAGSAETGGAD